MIHMTNTQRQCLILATAALTLAIVVGCTIHSPGVTQLVPIQIGAEGSAPITFTRLIIRVPSGTSVGAHFEGWIKLPKFKYIWQSNLTIASDEFRVVASEHLKSRGYTIMGGDGLLFGKDEPSKAEYQLGGMMQSLFYNSFGPDAGNYSESSVTIEWQVYNVYQTQVVYTTTTKGYGKQSGVGSVCIQGAFRSALDNLLADAGFVATVRKSVRKAWDQSTDESAPISITSCASEHQLFLPDNVQSVLRSVLTIQAGGTIGIGVIISSDGWAITAGHVVAGLSEVAVRMQSGLELTATVVRVDSQQDVALIRLPGRGHSCLNVVIGDEPKIGTDLFAIGAPTGEGLAFSVTKGVVSGFREWQGKRYIQTDAALNPGNSGGPLLSPDGRIVGIVSWKIIAPGFEGLAFGVPIQALSDRLRIAWK
jgi:S1-C subfamily serine protease